jgi:hypothetical protein
VALWTFAVSNAVGDDVSVAVSNDGKNVELYSGSWTGTEHYYLHFRSMMIQYSRPLY